ncbi:HNH endonuclease [Streptomyces sp. NPDC020875]|uniref:HNH endonuclease n=1 Tax=Streptomyces sp. NPDC020875 TaxID=3154898 RepID=UPI0034106A4B
MTTLRRLRVHQQHGVPTRHKPLSLLWAFARVARGLPGRAAWREYRGDMHGLMAQFGQKHSAFSPEHSFWRLRSSGLWQVHGLPDDQADSYSAAHLDHWNPEGGLTEQVERLLADPRVRIRAISTLRKRFLPDISQDTLLRGLDLAGYTTASGLPRPDAPDAPAVPAPRRPTSGSTVVRDQALVAEVKALHGNACQVCGLALPTLDGTYSEAAHIRGLGRPHNGPDVLTNLLVLCPNHHVQFDTLAIYIALDGTVRTTSDDTLVFPLRHHPSHPLDPNHLDYHRALCGK